MSRAKDILKQLAEAISKKVTYRTDTATSTPTESPFKNDTTQIIGWFANKYNTAAGWDIIPPTAEDIARRSC